MTATSHLFTSYDAAGLHEASSDRFGGRRERNYTCPECSHTRKPHNQKIKCLNVNFEKGLWRCNHCDWHGRLRTAEDEEAHKRRAQLQAEKQFVAPPPLANKTGVSDLGLAWFEHERHIPRAVVERYDIQEKVLWMPDAFRKAVVALAKANPQMSAEEIEQLAHREAKVPTLLFPYTRHGELVNIKYRARDSKDFRLHKNAELIFYGLDDVLDTREAYLVEGEMDKLAFAAAGIYNVLSVPNGSALSKEEMLEWERTGKFDQNKPLKLEYLDNCWDELQHIETWYLSTDTDAPGMKLRAELVRRLGPERCRFLRHPDGCKDANDVLKQFGAEGVRQLRETAAVPPIDGVVTVDDLYDELVDLVENGVERGVPVGVTEFDPHYSFKLPMLDVVTGVPGDGKTTVVMWMIAVTALQLGWKWVLYSSEQGRLVKLLAQVYRVVVGKPYTKGSHDRMTKADVDHWRSFMREHIILLDYEKVDTPEAVMEKTAALAQSHGVNARFVDPWNSMNHVYKPQDNGREDLYITRIMTAFRNQNARFNMATILNVHPNREGLKRQADGSFPVVGPRDISGGPSFWNRTDNLWTVHRRRQGLEDYTSDIYFWKIKYQDEIGVPTAPGEPVVIEFEPRGARFHGYASRTAPECFRASVPERAPIRTERAEGEAPVIGGPVFQPLPSSTFDSEPPAPKKKAKAPAEDPNQEAIPW